MLLTLTSTADSATDLGYLLHKHPDRVQQIDLSFGTAHVFYPEARDDRCTVAVLVEVDPQRGRKRQRSGGGLEPYVNDRRDAASSMMSVALRGVFGTAMSRRCDARPELVETALPLIVSVAAVPADDHELPGRLFAPLGWQVDVVSQPLDPEVPRWGEAPYVDLTLTGRQTVADALQQLYVLLPVLGGRKHYWVGSDEVDKLLRAGAGWLPDHPEQQLIMNRYLAYRHSYVRDAEDRLAAQGESPADRPADDAEEADDDHRRPTSARARQDAVLAELLTAGAQRVIDLGCGEGALLVRLAAESEFTEIVGADPSPQALDRASRRMAAAPLAERQREQVTLRQSSAVYRDPELDGFDAIVLMEVIEHLDPDRLPDLEQTVFAGVHPATVIVTTPNRAANAGFAGLAEDALRHSDHRFEWDRTEFAAWANAVAERTGYQVRIEPVSTASLTAEPLTQLAVFTRTGESR